MCGVSPGGALAGRLASAAVTQEPSAIWIMVVTRRELVVFKPVHQGLHKPEALGDELLRIALSDIVRVERRPSILTVGFRLALSDGSSVSLRAMRGVHHGREVVKRLAQLHAEAVSRQTPSVDVPTKHLEP